MHLMLKTTLMTLLVMSTQAFAAPGDCPHTPKAKPPVVNRPKTPPRIPTPPVKSAQCGCTGQPGPKGDKGDPGETGIEVVALKPVVIVVPVRDGAIAPRLGVMGSVYGPHGDWSWGPALQLGTDLNEKNELVVDLGLGLPFTGDPSPGRESGLLLHVGVAHSLTKHVGLTLGVHYTSINGSGANGGIDGRYLAVDGGVVLRKSWKKVNLRVEVAPALGGLRDSKSKDDTQFSFGVTSSAFLGVNW